MSDRIILEGLVLFGHHGALTEERALGEQFEIDVEMETSLAKAGASDALADTINYGDVYAAVREIVEGPSVQLVEHLADRISARLLSDFSPDAVRIRVRKPRKPVRGGVMRSVGVEIYRKHPKLSSL